MKEKTTPLILTYVLIALAVASCAFGVYRGEVKTVHRKAVNICMECIGIG